MSYVSGSSRWFLMAVAYFVCVGITFAQPPFGGFRPPPDPLLEALDKNKDGELSPQEIQAAFEALKVLDKNKDGKLTRDEIRPRFGPPGGRGGPGGRTRLKLVKKFDKDGDGQLSMAERQQARAYVKTNRPAGGRGGRGGRGGPRPPFFGGGGSKPKPGPKVALSDVKHYPGRDLYEPTILRTFFLEFANNDWERELADFYRTDVEVPAKLTVDGKTVGTIGVRFRGNSSFFTVQPGQKRSFNLSIDYADNKRDLYGYNTLNLLSAHADPSLLREALFCHIARNYIPAPKANFVKVIINGESWGVYVNVQQFNKDFLKDNFDTRKGVRWKIPAGFRGPGALVYSGDDKKNYDGSFQLKSKDRPKAWTDLIGLCKALKDTAPAEAEKKLDAILNLDCALWFLALDNIFIDGDGYLSRGSDYVLYQDGKFGRFYPLPYDSNETFRYTGSGGPGFRPTGRPGATLEPLVHLGEQTRPLCSVLLANPRLRARYLAHMRTIVDEWLDWKKLAPVVEQYHKLIDAEVKIDTRKLYSYKAFREGKLKATGEGMFRATQGLKQFVDERRAFLLAHPEFKKPTPSLGDLAIHKTAAGEFHVRVKVGQPKTVNKMLMYYATKKLAPFQSVTMYDDGKHHDGQAGDGLFAARLPTLPLGTTVRYYVEARAATTQFLPRGTEFAARTFKIPAAARPVAVVLNEVMANNTSAVKDPQGEWEDFIELYNGSDKTVNLSGLYLSDSKKKPRKWAFPAGTTIAPKGYIVVWADEDGRAPSGLHANFKLSKKGETIYFVDADERGNAILDTIGFGPQRANVAFGRLPNGNGRWQVVVPTPGRANQDREP